LVTDGVELLPLAPRQVEQKRSQGALLVDVRSLALGGEEREHPRLRNRPFGAARQL
jgi:hypothetical protein